MKGIYVLSVILFLASASSLGTDGESGTTFVDEEQLSNQERSLIIGGDSASHGEYPYFAHFASPGCGGALIAPDIVLTAGHCKLDKTSKYGTVTIGKYSSRMNQDGTEESFIVVEDSRHPSFDDKVCCGQAGNDWFYGVQNDFMVLKLSGESTARPVRLSRNASMLQPGDELTVIGFGDIDPGRDYVEPNKLKEVTLNYLTNDECVSKSIYPASLLNEASMCATDRSEDACAGDSGGPLLIKGGTAMEDLMVGIVSWGWQCGVYPGVYARVSEGFRWLRREVCRLSANPPSRFGCPTIAPAPTPLPTEHPTVRPTPRPTPRPTKPQPTATPTRFPTLQPSLGSSQQRTISLEKVPEPTEAPTISGNAHSDEAKEINAATASPTISYEGDRSNAGTYRGINTTKKSIVRLSLPEGTPCSVASTSPVVCCSSMSNNTGGTSGNQDCIPVRDGRDFGGIGLFCESASWVQTNDPEAYDPSICDLFPSTSLSESSSLFGDRQYLPQGMACSDVTDHRECCGYLDNRMEQGNIYHGQPCVPLHSGNNASVDLGVCQPANFVAENAPERAMNCEKLLQDDETILLSNATDPWQIMLQKLLQEIKDDILWEQGERTIERIDLPSGQTCDTIEDPLVCCAARYMDANITRNCVPVKTALLGKPADTHQPRRGMACRPMEHDMVMDEDDDAIMFNSSDLDNVEISSATSTTMSVSNTSRTSPSSGTTNTCDRMVQILQRRTRLSRLECSSLRSPRSCCSAVDTKGQPCMPIRLGKNEDPSCVSMEWVISHHPNVTLLECSTRQPLEL